MDGFMADAMGCVEQCGDSGPVWGDREFYDGSAFAVGAFGWCWKCWVSEFFAGVRSESDFGDHDCVAGFGDSDGAVHVFDVHECGGLHGVPVGVSLAGEAGSMVGIFDGVGAGVFGAAKRDCLVGATRN